MKIIHKKIFLTLIVSISIFFSALTSLYISEVFFFDNFYYQKSAVHGYLKIGGRKTSTEWSAESVINIDNDRHPVAKRTLALKRLFFSDSPSVLGLDSDDKSFKIKIIGDSLMYGSGVKDKYTTGEVLEKKLDSTQNSKADFSVETLALPGDSIVDNFLKFKKSISQDRPNLSIITVVDNDLDIWCNKYPGGVELCRKLQDSCPQTLLINPLKSFSLSWEQYVNYFYEPSISEDYANICYFENIIKEILSTNNEVIFFFPTQLKGNDEFLNETQKLSKKVVSRLAKIIRENGGNVISLDDSLEPFIYKPVSSLESHPSIETHEAYAQLLFGKIMENHQF